MDPPHKLVFYTWRNKNKQREHLCITYDTHSRELRVRIDDNEDLVTEALTATGKVAEVWDFFIGSELVVFGKKTVLKQCDQKTSAWISKLVLTYESVKVKLETELRKYDTSKLTSSVLRTPVEAAQGCRSLRDYITQIRWLKDRLAGFRPKVANRITASISGLS